MALKLGFQVLGVGAADQFEVGDAAGNAGRLDVLESSHFSIVRCDDQFPASAVGNAVLETIAIQQRFPLDAKGRLFRAWRIVDAGVNDLAVARARYAADPVFRFENQNLSALNGKAPRDRQPNHAGADHYAVNVIRHGRSWRDVPRAAKVSRKLDPL